MDEHAKIEEYFAYGKFADAGGARFLTEEDMWAYLTSKAGDLIFDLNGQKIYIGADKIGEDPPRVKALRKVVGTIIEANGRDWNGRKAAGHLYANYAIGYVLWKRNRVAEWDETSGKVCFTEHGTAFEQAFQKLTK